MDVGFVESLFRVGKSSRVFRDVGWLQPLSPSPSGVPVGREAELRAIMLKRAQYENKILAI